MAIELWGGHECSVNRVGDTFLDQTRLSGHHDRIEDLDRFAALGVRRLRYPVLWERVAPHRADQPDWTWSDTRLTRIRALGMSPIIGLLHHGSGPAYTSLVSENFVPLFTEYARVAAERYDWADAWTPINEPLTTARFSALYGLWYPHARDERLFWLAQLNQIDAIRAAMKEVRRINPSAKLVQTEDLGRTYSTDPTAQQAESDNHRRWLTWDFLFGRVTEHHPLWPRITALGFEDRARAIADDPCPPDIIGIDHYLTSDRFLDHRLPLYPPCAHGGNGRIAYADTEAIRVAQCEPQGMEGAIHEAWARYGAPIAVTECFNGCTRDEQIRWFVETWRVAERLAGAGVDIRGVSAWSLLGAHEWNSLLTRQTGHYECGAYDVRSTPPRKTALADAIRALAQGEPVTPAADGEGWWRRDIRLAFPPARYWEDEPPRRFTGRDQPILIAGASGTLGRAFARACFWRGLPYVLTSRDEVHLGDLVSMQRALEEIKPSAIINAAGWVRVDDAERERAACLAANAHGAAALAQLCAAAEIPYVAFSSDLVFDGAANRPYVESDAPNPLCVYGESKRDAEHAILKLGGPALMIRTAAFFSPHDEHNFAVHVLRELGAGRPVRAASDCIVSPTYVPDLVDTTLDLLLDQETGLWHLANRGEISWSDFGYAIAGRAGLARHLLAPTPAQEMNWPARRPHYAALSSERAMLLPKLDSALDRFAAKMHDRQSCMARAPAA